MMAIDSVNRYRVTYWSRWSCDWCTTIVEARGLTAVHSILLAQGIRPDDVKHCERMKRS